MSRNMIKKCQGCLAQNGVTDKGAQKDPRKPQPALDGKKGLFLKATLPHTLVTTFIWLFTFKFKVTFKSTATLI